MLLRVLSLLLSGCVWSAATPAADRSLSENPQLAKYFEAEVQRIEQQNSLLQYQSLEQWQAARPQLKAQLFENLGLNPLPERTELQPEITGTVEESDFIVENLHFQSLPGLYVTANFYRPRDIQGPLPTVLYVCGHARRADGDVSFGNKTAYHHHGSWFARHGYACLTIDTLQLGEIEGIHHGTYREGRWWWNSRGYTPAGVEAWNCIRALDYLETRPEVDASRFGVTGRSGGGAYSWWVAALDERIRCSVPVAGITTLRNHVVDGCVEGHCDCMFMVNSSRWDYATVAALVAPRPLLISNSDKDSIFPLEGVVEIHRQARHIYQLYDQSQQLGLQITEGPHRDTQELRVHAFRWMNRWLKDDDSLIEKPAVSFFEPAQLRVFSELPGDQRNTSIDEDFVPAVSEPSPELVEEILSNPATWHDQAVQQLRQVAFTAWPDNDPQWQPPQEVTLTDVPLADSQPAASRELHVTRIHFLSQTHVPLFVDLLHRTADLQQIRKVRLFHADDERWQLYRSLLQEGPTADGDQQRQLAQTLKTLTQQDDAVAVFSSRGVGAAAWQGDERKQIQIRRRFQLIGTTADAMRVWDLVRVTEVLRDQCAGLEQLILAAPGDDSQLVLTAALFASGVDGLWLKQLPQSRDQEAVFLNAARFTSLSRLLALATYVTPVTLKESADATTQLTRSLTSDPRWNGQQLTVED